MLSSVHNLDKKKVSDQITLQMWKMQFKTLDLQYLPTIYFMFTFIYVDVIWT